MQGSTLQLLAGGRRTGASPFIADGAFITAGTRAAAARLLVGPTLSTRTHVTDGARPAADLVATHDTARFGHKTA